MFLELAHVSLRFAGYRDLEAPTIVEPVLSGTVLSGHPLYKRSVFKVPKIAPLDVL